MHSFRKMMRIYKGIVIPIALCCFSLAVVLIGIIPGVKIAYQHYLDSNVLAKEVESIKNRLAILEGLDENTLRDSVNDLLIAVPSEKSLPTILSTIDRLCLESQVALLDITVANPGSLATDSATKNPIEQKIGSNMISSEIVLEGTIEQIKIFLDRLISIRRLLRVSQISMIFSGDGRIRSQMRIDAFYSLLPKTLGKASETLSPLTTNEETVISKIQAYPNYSTILYEQSDPSVIQWGQKIDPFSP